MTAINPHDLTRNEALAMLAESIEGADAARLVAGITRGASHRRAARIAEQHGRNALALADRLYGAPSADVAAMSDDALLLELGAL